MEEILNILYDFLFAMPEGVTGAPLPALAVAGIAQGVGSLVGGIFGAGRARRARRAAAREKRRLQGELKSLEKSRQNIINPYDNFKNLSSLAKDLSGKLSNPYANLSVATKGAEIQMEQTDIALANTLDTLRATGASAGGATALAQAALQSKQGVAASIEQQEAQNEKLRAQGQQQLEQLQMNEGIRVQSVQIGEGQRMQQADAAGRSFMFNALEKRQDDKINYTRGQISGAKQREQRAYDQGTRAISGAISGVTGALSTIASTGAFGGTTAAAGAANPVGSSGGMSFSQIQKTINSGGNLFDTSLPSNALQYYSKQPSDRRLKKNIKLIGKSASGLKIYAFEYINKMFGEGVYQGVMSDEVPQYAVVKHSDGFDRVDYSKLDVKFKQI